MSKKYFRKFGHVEPDAGIVNAKRKHPSLERPRTIFSALNNYQTSINKPGARLDKELQAQ